MADNHHHTRSSWLHNAATFEESVDSTPRNTLYAHHNSSTFNSTKDIRSHRNNTTTTINNNNNMSMSKVTKDDATKKEANEKKNEPTPIHKPAGASAPWWRKLISVRALTTLLCVILIICTAIAVLLICFEFSLRAARDVATNNAKSIATQAKGDLEAVVRLPLAFVSGWQYMYTRGERPMPGDEIRLRPKTSKEWASVYWDRLITAMRASSFMYKYAAVGFEDGNFVGCLNVGDANEIFQCRVVPYLNRITDSSAPDEQYNENFYRKDYTLVSTETLNSTYDPRSRVWYKSVEKKPFSSRWSSVYLSVDEPRPLLDVKSALYNASNMFIGTILLTLELPTLSAFLKHLVLTKNAVIVLLDNNNILLASSYDVPFSKETNLMPEEKNASLPINCVNSDTRNGATRDIKFCRETSLTYDYPPLHALQTSEPELVNTGDAEHAHLIELSGERYFVSVVPIETPGADDMHWRFALFIPESDVTGDIVKGRDLALYITIGIVALATLLCLVVVTLLLKPLAAVADRMYRVAALQDMDEDEEEQFDDEDEDEEEGDFDPDNKQQQQEKQKQKQQDKKKKKNNESRLYEIWMIQHAFGLLVAELSKVKSFLPQSVLAQLYGGDAAEEEETPAGDVSTLATEKDMQGSRHTSGFFNNRAMESMRTNSTADNSTGYSGGPGGKAVLSQRKVTALVMNIRYYHAIGGKLGAERLARFHSDLVGMVTSACSEHKGVLDGFQGDHFLVSFNAVTTVGNHATAACHAALAVRRGLLRLLQLKRYAGAMTTTTGGTRTQMSLSSGISSGQALVGNMGSSSVKRFTVIGHAVGTAGLLERLCKRFKGGNVFTIIDGFCLPEVESFFDILLQDCVMLPAFGGAVRRALVASLHRVKQVSSDEWMYQLEAGATASPFTEVNDIVAAFYSGEATAAVTQTALKKMLSEDNEQSNMNNTSSNINNINNNVSMSNLYNNNNINSTAHDMDSTTDQPRFNKERVVSIRDPSMLQFGGMAASSSTANLAVRGSLGGTGMGMGMGLSKYNSSNALKPPSNTSLKAEAMRAAANACKVIEEDPEGTAMSGKAYVNTLGDYYSSCALHTPLQSQQ